MRSILKGVGSVSQGWELKNESDLCELENESDQCREKRIVKDFISALVASA